jgi:Mn2+/Fe2+ NRAMP family transporter
MTDVDIDAEALAVPAARIARHRATRGPAHKGLLGRLGARLITGASNDDPSGIATYSQGGARFG